MVRERFTDLSFYCVHQRSLRISTTLSILRKYEQKALCTKTPLSRGVTGKTSTDTENKIKVPLSLLVDMKVTVIVIGRLKFSLCISIDSWIIV